MRTIARLALVGLLGCAASAHAEDGYDLWLRYRPIEAPWGARYRTFATELVAAHGNGDAALRELTRGIRGLLGAAPNAASRVSHNGAIVLGTPNSPLLSELHLDLQGLGAEGYLIRSVTLHGHRATLIAANSERSFEAIDGEMSEWPV